MRFVRSLLSAVLAACLVTSPIAVRADDQFTETGHKVEHVLLISVDGLHALDLSNYVASHRDSTLAMLSRNDAT
jgi:hypothetical protein